MKLRQNTQQRCQLCHPSTRQQKLINKMILRQIIKVKSIKPSFWIQFPPDPNNQPLHRLSKIAHDPKNSKNSDVDSCTHVIWMRSLQKAGYSVAEMSSACQCILSIKAQRTYQLWLLESQIKNIAEKICSASSTALGFQEAQGSSSVKQEQQDISLKEEPIEGNIFQPNESKQIDADATVKSEEPDAQHQALQRSSLLTNCYPSWPVPYHSFPAFFTSPYP